MLKTKGVNINPILTYMRVDIILKNIEVISLLTESKDVQRWQEEWLIRLLGSVRINKKFAVHLLRAAIVTLSW